MAYVGFLFSGKSLSVRSPGAVAKPRVPQAIAGCVQSVALLQWRRLRDLGFTSLGVCGLVRSVDQHFILQKPIPANSAPKKSSLETPKPR